MVAAEQNLRNFPAFVVGRARVVRVVENSVGERILLSGVVIAENAGDQAHHRISNDQRRQNAARENKVADGNLIVDQVVGHALVDAFVVAAKQDQVFF